MRKILIAALLVLFMAPFAHAKNDAKQPFLFAPPVGPDTELEVKYLKLYEYTVATLPAAGTAGSGALVLITDGDGGTDCTTGGGTDRVLCRSTGSAWASVDTQAAGSAEVQDEAFTAGNFDGDTSHGVSQDDYYDREHARDTDDDGSYADEAWLTTYLTEAELTSTLGAAYDTEAELDALFAAKQNSLTFGIADTNALQVDATAGAPNDDEIARFTASGIEGLTYAELATAAESAIEGVVDLQDLQGAVTDAQVPDTITVDAATLASTVTVTDDEATNDAHEVVFTTDGATMESDGDFNYNPSTGTVSATVFSGTVAGGNVDISNMTTETAIAADDLVIIYDTSAAANRGMTRGNFVTGIGAGQAVTFDIGDDGGNDSVDVGEIATTGDTNSIFTEPSADKILIDLGNNWPQADTAVAASAQAITDNAIATVDDLDAADNDFAKFTASGLEGRSYAEVRTDLGIDTAANLETSLSLGAYASDLLGTTSEANFKSTVNLEIGTDVLAQQTIGISNDNLLEVDGTPLDGEVAVFTAAGINGLSEAEFKAAYNIEAGTDFEGVDAEIARMDTADTVGADWEWQDGIAMSFGNDNDVEIAYDETTDDRLEITTTLSAATGDEEALALIYTTNKATSGNDTGLLISMTDTASPGTSHPLEIQVGGTAVWWVDHEGVTGTPAANEPYYKWDENDGVDYYMGIYDTTVDRLEIRRSATVNTNVDAYFDADGAYVAGNLNLSTGHTYRINGTQIALANLSDGESHAANHIQGGADEVDGDLIDIDYAETNYTPATTGVASNVNHLAAHLEGIDNALGAISGSNLAGLTDTADVDYTAGTVLIGDGTNSFDEKAISGVITLAGSGATAFANGDRGDITASGGNFTLDADVVAAAEMADADHGDVAWSSGVATVQAVSGANAVDSDAYVDGSIDAAHLAADVVDETKIADDGIDSEHYNDGSIDAVHLSFTAAPGAGNDNYAVTYDNASGGFTLVEMTGGAETNSLETTITGIADTEIFVGSGADSGAFVTVSGDATLANTGALTIASDAVEYSMLADSSVGVVTASKSANYTVGTDDGKEAYGGVIYVTSAATITLPAVSARMAVTVITIGATAVSVDTNASDRMYLDGTALDDGDKATNTSTTGDMLVCTYESAAGWYCASGSPDGDHWTDGGP